MEHHTQSTTENFFASLERFQTDLGNLSDALAPKTSVGIWHMEKGKIKEFQKRITVLLSDLLSDFEQIEQHIFLFSALMPNEIAFTDTQSRYERLFSAYEDFCRSFQQFLSCGNSLLPSERKTVELTPFRKQTRDLQLKTKRLIELCKNEISDTTLPESKL